MLRALTVGLDVQILRNRRSRTAQCRFGSMGASKPMEARHGRVAWAMTCDCGTGRARTHGAGSRHGCRHTVTAQARGMRLRHGARHVLTNPTHLFSFLGTAILRASGKLSTSPSKTGHVGTRDVGESPTTALIRACSKLLRFLPSKHEESCPSEQNHRGSHHGTQMRVFPQRGRERRIATKDEMR